MTTCFSKRIKEMTEKVSSMLFQNALLSRIKYTPPNVFLSSSVRPTGLYTSYIKD